MSSPMPFHKNVRETLCTPSLNPLCLSLVLVYSVTMHIFPKRKKVRQVGHDLFVFLEPLSVITPVTASFNPLCIYLRTLCLTA